MTTTFGKTWGLRRMADAAGHFKMVAVDQRPPIVSLIAAKRGIDADAVTFADIVAVKRLLARALAPHASALLVDPNYGYPAAADWLLPSRGLIMTLEDHRFVESARGRHSAAIADWTVAKIRRLGADGVKVLAWYRPDADAATLAHQHSFVEGIGRACAEEDIPFVFELLVYPFPGEASHTTGYVEDPGKHPQRVVDSVRAFADPRFPISLRVSRRWPPRASRTSRSCLSSPTRTPRAGFLIFAPSTRLHAKGPSHTRGSEKGVEKGVRVELKKGSGSN